MEQDAKTYYPYKKLLLDLSLQAVTISEISQPLLKHTT